MALKVEQQKNMDKSSMNGNFQISAQYRFKMSEENVQVVLLQPVEKSDNNKNFHFHSKHRVFG